MLTILSWLWKQPGGRAKYTTHHANIWADMVRRNLKMDHEVALVTNMTEGLDRSIRVIPPPADFEDVRIPTWNERMPQCLRRIAMFRPDAADIFGKRFVSMDLDCVITGPLDPLFDRPEDFIMYRGTTPERPYNGSMMMMTAGARSQVYTEFTPEGAAEAGRKYVGSDQAWISHVLGWGEAVWTLDDGVYWQTHKRRQEGTADARIIFFPGKMKPWEVKNDPVIIENYRMSRGGQCLILGYGETLWEDVAAALETHRRFETVIAAPEAAAVWPGEVFATAMSDAECEALAYECGYEEWTFCGRQPAQEEAVA
jgi:hypothetical protein